MAASGDYPICTICAIRLYESGDQDTLEGQGPSGWYPDMWKTSAVLLSGPRWPLYAQGPVTTVPDEAVTRQVGTPSWYPGQVRITPGGESVFTQWEYVSDNGTDTYWYFGIHPACEEIANRFMRTSREARVRSIGDLWMILDQRCAKTSADLHLSTPFLPNIPENAPGEPMKLGRSRYYLPRDSIPGDDAEYDDLYEWWEDDPLFIPDLTGCLVSNLEQHMLSDSAGLKSRDSFEALPQEMKDKTTADLLNQPITLECTYLVPQSHWKKAFLQIPFLWDLDKKVIDDKVEGELEVGMEWNWEKITRQLMTPVTMVDEKDRWNPVPWSYDQVGLTVPHGLNNRRRIWQILEDMYPSDFGMRH
ncbi:hypothetical protein QQX98_002348 [Neonectria punicea]|uniref:Uncharacterized protein n=1 Tax=Neonectria punicea TaxID=979145 RepID=A0ABR1HKF7_9HYPO